MRIDRIYIFLTCGDTTADCAAAVLQDRVDAELPTAAVKPLKAS